MPRQETPTQAELELTDAAVSAGFEPLNLYNSTQLFKRDLVIPKSIRYTMQGLLTVMMFCLLEPGGDVEIPAADPPVCRRLDVLLRRSSSQRLDLALTGAERSPDGVAILHIVVDAYKVPVTTRASHRKHQTALRWLPGPCPLPEGQLSSQNAVTLLGKWVTGNLCSSKSCFSLDSLRCAS